MFAKLVTQKFPLWSNHRFLIFLLQWLSTSRWNSLNLFIKFHTSFSSNRYIGIYLLIYRSLWSRRIYRSRLHTLNNIHQYVWSPTCKSPVLKLWPINGILVIYLLEKICKRQVIQKIKRLQNPSAWSFFMHFSSNMT